MSGPATLTRIEDIIDGSAVAPRIEALLPIGVRRRQLKARTLLAGMMLTLDDRRPAYLTEARQALTALPEPDQARLGVTEDWRNGPHQLTYRQAGRTFNLMAGALAKEHPDGAPSSVLARIGDNLLEASIPGQHAGASTALAVDWTDTESFSRPPRHGTTECADPEASRGHRNSNLPGPKGEMFFGPGGTSGSRTAHGMRPRRGTRSSAATSAACTAWASSPASTGPPSGGTRTSSLPPTTFCSVWDARQS